MPDPDIASPYWDREVVKPHRQDGDGLQQARDIVTAYFDCHGINEARAAGFNIVARIMEAGLTIIPLPTRAAAATALEQIADIAEGSRTANSLPHIARIARETLATLRLERAS